MKEKWLWWLVVLGGLAAVTVYLIRTPVTGKITYKLDKFPTPSPMEYIRYDAKNFSFAYENKYQLRENAVGGKIKGNWELVGNPGVVTHLVITESQAVSGDIEDIPGVLMRRLKKDQYTESTINWGETEGVFFNKTDGLEMTAFFLKDGQAVTVAMTADSNDDTGLRNEFQKLVDSMQIKNSGGP